MNPYAIPPLAAFVLSVCLGAYVLRKDPKATINRLFVLITLCVAVWTFCDFMIQSEVGLMSQAFWATLLPLATIFIPPLALHFTYFFPRMSKPVFLKEKYLYGIIYGLAVIFVVLVLANYEPTLVTGLFTIYLLGLFASAIARLFNVWRHTPSSSIEHKQTYCVLIGTIAIVSVGGLTNLVLPLFEVPILRLASSFAVVWLFFVAYAIVKYKLFVLPPISRFFIPAPEARLRTKLKYRLKEGRSYLIKESERGPKIFQNQVTHDVPGLWLTTLRPNKIREKYGLARSSVLYLTSERVSGEVTVPPNTLDKAIGVVSSYFFARPRKSVVFVDCFKEFVVANGFKRAVNFLNEMTELCSRNNSNLIVQIDPSKFTEKQLAAIEKAIARS